MKKPLWRKISAAFSLVELLAVIALLVVLLTFATIGFNSILTSSNLEQAGRTVLDEINLARQSAATRNANVEVRFIRKPSSESGNSTPVFWQMQSGIHDKRNGNIFTPIHPPARLPAGTLLIENEKFSPMLHYIPKENSSLPAYEYVPVTIRPSGEINPVSSLPHSSRSQWCVTVISQKDAAAVSASDLNDFITIQIDPLTSRAKVYRP